MAARLTDAGSEVKISRSTAGDICDEREPKPSLNTAPADKHDRR
jgi:hypothetical protein